jgi:hypothetical protein
MSVEASNRIVPHPRSEKTRVLDLIEQYLANGKSELVQAAIKGEISTNTLSNWLRDKERAERAYKSDALLRIRAKLPSLADLQKYDAFSFALAEMGLERSSQTDLKFYHGIYSLQHKLNAESIDTIAISAKSAPAFATFWFRYRSFGKMGVCDGLVVLRRSRLYLIGLSRGSMFSGHVRTVADPAHDMLKGLAVYEDFNGENISASRIVLVNQAHGLSVEERNVVDQYIGVHSMTLGPS